MGHFVKKFVEAVVIIDGRDDKIIVNNEVILRLTSGRVLIDYSISTDRNGEPKVEISPLGSVKAIRIIVIKSYHYDFPEYYEQKIDWNKCKIQLKVEERARQEIIGQGVPSIEQQEYLIVKAKGSHVGDPFISSMLGLDRLVIESITFDINIKYRKS